MVIVPLVVGGAAVVLITTLQDSSGVNSRISNSADAENTSAVYVRDVQSATYLTTDGTPSSAPWGASPPAVCGTSLPGYGYVLGAAWSTAVPGGFGTTTVINSVTSYWVLGTVHAMDGVTLGATLTSATAGFTSADVGKTVLETDGQGVIPVGTTIAAVNTPLSVTLSTSATGNTPLVAFVVAPRLVRSYCSGSLAPTTSIVSHDFVSAPPWATITCGTAVTTPPCMPSAFATGWSSAVGVSSVTIATLTSGNAYSYSLTAAPYTPSSAGFPPGGTAPSFLMLGSGVSMSNGTISINGSADINGGTISSGGSFTATGVQTSRPSGSDSCLSPYCSPPSTSWTYGAPPVADPLAGLSDPPEPMSSSIYSGNAACNAINNELSSGNPVTLQPGEYQCSGMNINNTTVILAPGLYVLDYGIKISSGTLDGTAGVLLYLPCTTWDSWDPNTNCNEQFNQSNGTVNMNPIGGTSPYQDLWFWQNKGDSSGQIVLNNGASTSLLGTLYAPTAQVNITQGGMTLGRIIAGSVNMSNGNVMICPQGSTC